MRGNTSFSNGAAAKYPTAFNPASGGSNIFLVAPITMGLIFLDGKLGME